MRSNLGTCTQLLLEYVGQDLVGQVISERTETLLTDRSIVITHTVSCARNWDMAPTTKANPKPSPCKPTSQSQLLSDFNQSISALFPRTFDGTQVQIPLCVLTDISSLLQAVNDGSSVDDQIRQRCVKLLRIIHKAPSPI